MIDYLVVFKICAIFTYTVFLSFSPAFLPSKKFLINVFIVHNDVNFKRTYGDKKLTLSQKK